MLDDPPIQHFIPKGSPAHDSFVRTSHLCVVCCRKRLLESRDYRWVYSHKRCMCCVPPVEQFIPKSSPAHDSFVRMSHFCVVCCRTILLESRDHRWVRFHKRCRYCGVPSNFEIGDFRQFRETIFMHPAGQRHAIWLTAHFFKWEHCDAVLRQGRIQICRRRRRTENQPMKTKQRRSNRKQNSGCENHPRPSRASCLFGTMSQLSCQLLCAGARGWFEREHGFEQQSQARGNPRQFQLSDGKRIELLSAVDVLTAVTGEWSFTRESKPKRHAERVNV